MNTPKTILTPLIAALALASTSALGGTVVLPAVTLPSTPVEINTILNTFKFDSNLGLLTDVAVTLTGSTTSTITDNEAAGSLPAAAVFVSVNTTLTFGGPSGPTALNIINPSANPIVPALTPGVTSAPWTLAGGPTVFHPAVNAGWQAPGGGALAVPVSTVTAANAQGIGTFAVATTDTLTAQITYTYTNTPVPEPKVYGALGAVICLGLLGYRQYRLKHS